MFGVYASPARDSFRIREVMVEHALREDPLPGLDYSFNPYVGCYHACAFCYVPRLLQVDRNEWGTSVVVKRNAATVLAREVRKRPRGLVMIATATDPYQYVEGKYRITRNALEVLCRAGWPVSVLSRSPLMERDIDLFQKFSEIDVGMSVPTLDDRARALLEPWAPPIEARLRCLGRLSEAGLDTFVSFAPAYPPTDGWTAERTAERFAALGVRRLFARTLDPRWGARDAMLARLAPSPLAAELVHIADREAMTKFLERLREACRAQGITVDERGPSRTPGERGLPLSGVPGKMV